MRVRAGAAAMLAAVLVGGGSVASAAGPGDPPAATTSSTAFGTAAAWSGTPGTATSTVTLITGDRVTLTQSGGLPRILGIENGEGREGVGFLQQIDNDRLYVIPTDVAGLVPDRLDRALFDVAGLAAVRLRHVPPGHRPRDRAGHRDRWGGDKGHSASRPGRARLERPGHRARAEAGVRRRSRRGPRPRCGVRPAGCPPGTVGERPDGSRRAVRPQGLARRPGRGARRRLVAADRRARSLGGGIHG